VKKRPVCFISRETKVLILEKALENGDFEAN